MSGKIRPTPSRLAHATRAVTTMRTPAEGEYKNGKVLAGLKNGGGTANQMPREVLSERLRVTEKVLHQEATDDEDYARVQESQEQFRPAAVE